MTHAPIETLPMPARLPRTIKCPKCFSHKVRFSAARSLFDELLKLIGCTPLRCHSCYYRWRKWFPKENQA